MHHCHTSPFSQTETASVNRVFMHQSILAMHIPPPPPHPLGNCEAFAHIVSPRGRAFAILSWPRDGAFAYPGATPWHLTHMVFKPCVYVMEACIGQDVNHIACLLVHQGLEKLADVFKGKCFLKVIWNSTWRALKNLGLRIKMMLSSRWNL